MTTEPVPAINSPLDLPRLTGAGAAVGHAEAGGEGRSAETARRYAGDWQAFRSWCARAGATVLPAAPATVATYLEQFSDRIGPGALARQLSAINAMHRRHAQPPPGSDPAGKAALRADRSSPRPVAAVRRSPSPDAA